MKLKTLTLVLGLACFFALSQTSLEARCRNFVSFSFSNVGVQPVPVVAQPAYVVPAPCYAAVPIPEYGPAPVVCGSPYYRPIYVAPAPVMVAPAPVYSGPNVGLSFGWGWR